jgi:XTP/dITP diphosphohydrolase
MNNDLTRSFLGLVDIMDELREKCPWDRKQTIHTLRNLTIEETYELADAILDENYNSIREELGDLLLHVLFYSRIGKEKGEFDLQSVIQGISEKLVFRHPHIYGNVEVKDEEEVKRNWEKLKQRENKKGILDGVPSSLPAMVKAYRLQEKAAQVGFDWETGMQVLEKVKEEVEELQLASAKGDDQASIEDEFGDVLFSLVNLARFMKLDPEAALERTNRKFISRFRYIEEHAGRNLTEMTLEELDDLWNQAKTRESGPNK